MDKRFIVTGLVALLVAGCALADGAKKQPKGWLIDAASDTERLMLLQRYLRGFDQPMWEVGERYRAIHEALTRRNHALAVYHWDKIKTTVENGYLKRPERRVNADRILLNTTWQEVRFAFQSHDGKIAWDGFSKARTSCLTCHIAESVPYMNDQPMFDLSAPASP